MTEPRNEDRRDLAGDAPAAPGYEVFVDRAYDAACGLLVELRDYIAGPSATEGGALPPADRARLIHELTKTTRRLTEAMAWLLMQKAVAAGEVGAADAGDSPEGRLPSDVDGDGCPEADLLRLPLAARGLIDRSRRLYAEVERLEAGLRGGAAQ